MTKKHYVIQCKMNTGAKWITLDNHKFATLDEAAAVMKKKQAAGLACEKYYRHDKWRRLRSGQSPGCCKKAEYGTE